MIQLNTPIDIEQIKKIDNLIICIYKISSPSGKIYIGQSGNFKERYKNYIRCKGRNQTRLNRSFLKYGVENHVFEIVHECTELELNELEIYYIKVYNSFNTKHGLNLKDGGLGGKPSDETKKRLSESHMGQIPWNKGKKTSPETIAKMSGVNNHSYGKKGINHPLFGRKHSEEQNRNHSEKMKGVFVGRPSPFKGIPKSEEFRKKMTEINRNRPPRTAEHIENNAKANRGKKRTGQALINIIEFQRKRRELNLINGKVEKRTGQALTNIGDGQRKRRALELIIKQERLTMIF